MPGNIPANGVKDFFPVTKYKVKTPAMKMGKGTYQGKRGGGTKSIADFKGIAAYPVKNAPRRVPVDRATPEGKAEGKKLIELAKKRFQLCAEAESKLRKQWLDDTRFRAGDQWPEGIKRQREKDGRPCLTINQIPQFVKRVTNEQRQNRPAIKVDPVSSGADQETAEIMQGLIRHIEYDSDAESAYDTAFDGAATGGFGYFRIITEYTDPFSFEQDIKIKRVRNPLQVYLDPYAKEPDRSDAKYGFYFETLSKEDFKKQYPNAEASLMDDWKSDGDSGWFDQEQGTCRVSEYFYIETDKQTIVQLSDGTVIDKAVLPETLPKGVTVVKERQTEVFAVKWCKMNGIEILEETDWPGKWIPIIPVLGDELEVDGQLILEGVVRHAMDPQRQYNFMASATTETIALAPKAPYIIAEGQLEGHEREWQSANVTNQAFLSYKPQSVNGTSVPPPQRQTFEPAIQSTTVAMMQASQDLRSVTGIHEAELGAPSNEISGSAIQARQAQSQVSNYNFQDNLKRALRHAGRIIVDLVPYIYDTERVIRIIGEDGTRDLVAVNTQPNPQGAPEDPATNLDRIYDVTVGKYDVVIDTGPSYQTQRQEASDAQLQLVKNFPQIMPIAGDILVGNMDIPGSMEIAERLKKALPPELQDNPASNLPPEAQQAMQQLTAQNAQLTQHLNAAQDDLDQKKSEKSMELESKERIAFAQIAIKDKELKLDYLKLQVSMVNADIAAKAASAESAFEAEMELVGQQIDNAHEFAMSQVQHNNALEQQTQQVAGQSQLSAQNAQQTQDAQPNDQA